MIVDEWRAAIRQVIGSIDSDHQIWSATWKDMWIPCQKSLRCVFVQDFFREALLKMLKKSTEVSASGRF